MARGGPLLPAQPVWQWWIAVGLSVYFDATALMSVKKVKQLNLTLLHPISKCRLKKVKLCTEVVLIFPDFRKGLEDALRTVTLWGTNTVELIQRKCGCWETLLNPSESEGCCRERQPLAYCLVSPRGQLIHSGSLQRLIYCINCLNNISQKFLFSLYLKCQFFKMFSWNRRIFQVLLESSCLFKVIFCE